MLIGQSLALAEKEILLGLRFKAMFFMDFLVNPIIFSVIFLVVYNTFFSAAQTSIYGISAANFVPFVLIGSLTHLYVNAGSTAFNSIFLTEKYWETAFGMLFVTRNNLALIFGSTLATAIKISFPTAIILAISFAAFPVSILTVLTAVLMLLLVLSVSLSFGLISGCFALSNENLVPIFNYFRYGLIFLSCFYYPIGALPRALHPLVQINPLYHAVLCIRSVWFGGGLPIFSIAYLLACAVFMPFFAVAIFDRVFKRYGVQGY